MSARPLPEDVMLCRFWPTVVSIAHLGKADEALEFVRELALLEGKLHMSIVPGERERQAKVASAGFIGRPMESRYAGTCQVCRQAIAIGDAILYNADLRRAAHDRVRGRRVTEITVMRDKYARGWPRHEHGDRAYVLPLGRALQREYSTDAHFVAYRTPNGRRLVREALDQGVAVELTCIAFDMDCPETHGTATPAPEAWRRELREKVWMLSEVHPGPFYYETKGGARIVYTQKEPTVLRSHDDAKEWTQNYAIAVAYLGRCLGIAADPSCNDWQRHYRLPHATRTPGGKPENWASSGDPHRIGDLLIQATDADVATAKRASTAFRKSRAVEPSALSAGGDGLFYHALRLRSHVGASAPRGGWYAVCPNRSQHTINTDWTDSTIVVPPDSGRELGLILCKHGHCWERFTVQQWLRMFSDSELEDARRAAGITSRRTAA